MREITSVETDTGSVSHAHRRPSARRLGFIGTGALTEAVIESLHRARCEPYQIMLSPRSESRSVDLAAKYPHVTRMHSNAEVAEASEVVFLAMRPQQLEAAVAGVRFRSEQIVISLLAGTPHALIVSKIAPATHAYRVSVTSAIKYRDGPVVVYPRDALVESLFTELGELIAVDLESDLDAVTQASALMSSHFQLQNAVIEWLFSRGVPNPIAASYVRSMFGGFAAIARSVSGESSRINPGEYETGGGLNECARRYLADTGWFERITQALNEIEAHVLVR